MVGLFKKPQCGIELSRTGYGLLSGFSLVRLALPAIALGVLLYYGVFHAGQSVTPRAEAAPSVDVMAYSSEASQLRRLVSMNTDNMLRLSGRDVVALMDEPELVRYDFPTVVWQYRKQACVLDVYFASVEQDVSFAPVVHYEMRGRDGMAASGCVDLMVSDGSQLAMADMPQDQAVQ